MTDSEGAQVDLAAEDSGGVERVNEVCSHAACSVHSFCFVEQLQLILESYGKSRATHFQRKPINVRVSPPACLRTSDDDALFLLVW